MQDTKSTKDQPVKGEKPETPKMAKPVTGSFKQSRKQLGSMLKTHRKTTKGDPKNVR